MTPDFDQECLSARVAFVLACIREDFEAIRSAFDRVFDLAVSQPEGALPFLSETPEMQGVIESGRQIGREMQREEANRDGHLRWLAEFPSPAQLRSEAIAQGNQAFHFHGYWLWPAEEAEHVWAVTNPYGIDDCAYLRTEKDFAWFLAVLKSDQDIGPVPPICQDPEEEKDWGWEQYAVCDEAATAVMASLLAEPSPFP